MRDDCLNASLLDPRSEDCHPRGLRGRTGSTGRIHFTYAGPRPHAPTEVDDTVPQQQHPNTRSLAYDANGNQVQWTKNKVDKRVVTFDEENRVVFVQENGLEQSEVLYDGSGQRAVKQADGADQMAYFGPNLTLRDGVFSTKNIFAGDTRVAVRLDPDNDGDGNVMYFHDDELGSANFVTDSQQNLQAHEEYFPTGELWIDETFDPQHTQVPYLFTGKELDTETNLYYFGARYYDPRLSMWISPDPAIPDYLGGDRHMGGVFSPQHLASYTYSWNRLLTLRDPDGRQEGVAGCFGGPAGCGAGAVYEAAKWTAIGIAALATWATAKYVASTHPATPPAFASAPPSTAETPPASGGAAPAGGASPTPPPVPPGAAAGGAAVVTAAAAAAQNPEVQEAVAETEGAWVNAAESMSARAAAYQQQIGGRVGQVFLRAGTKFDAFVNGVLRDGKGPGYATFVKNGQFVQWFRGKEGLVDEARRQLQAAGGTPIEWRVAEPEAAAAIQKAFGEAGITGINIVVEAAKSAPK
jgi:RHS repeat-associated protein